MNNTAKKNLLGVCGNVLQFLHDAKGYDFTKPFEIIEGTETFTLNSLKKEAVTSGIIEDVYSGNYALFISIIEKYSENPKEELKYVDITGGFNKFEQCDNTYRISKRNKNIDNFYRISDFEEVRKGRNRHEKMIRWFLIMQDKKYKLEKICKPSDKTERINTTTKIDGYDKSGYFTKDIHLNYERRLKALKAEKAKAKADAETNKFIDKAKQLMQKIEELKPILIRLINNNEFDKIDKAFRWKGYGYIYNGMEEHINRLNNKLYSSVSYIESREKDLESCYNEIVEIING